VPTAAWINPPKKEMINPESNIPYSLNSLPSVSQIH
jgi:hypothetical protein